MLIHEDGVKYLNRCVYSYFFKDGSDNLLRLNFTTKLGEKPETGDKIVNNKLVKAGA